MCWMWKLEHIYEGTMQSSAAVMYFWNGSGLYSQDQAEEKHQK